MYGSASTTRGGPSGRRSIGAPDPWGTTGPPTITRRADATNGEEWSANRSIEAALLVDLLTLATGAEGWTHRPLRLAGARITGSLDLEAAELTRPLHLENCFLEERVILNDAQALTIRLTGCHLPGFDGHALHTRGDLRLNDGFVATGEVTLLGAHIGGTLNCDRATFANGDGVALNADLIKVDESLWLGRATVAGEVVLLGASIGGTLSCGRSTFTNHNGPAIHADGLHVGDDLLFDQGFTAVGEVRLPGARIGGRLDASGATLTNDSGPALRADRLRASDGLFLWKGFIAAGTGAVGAIGLRDAQVGVLAVDLAGIKDLHAAPGVLTVDGLTYSGLPNGASVADWLEVLAHRTPQYAAQPYQQLAAAARAAGDDGANRKILIAQRRTQVNNRALTPAHQRAWARFTWLTLGYGYQPWRALLLLLGVVAIAVALTLIGGSHGALAHNGAPCTIVDRIGVALDLSLPLIKTAAQDSCTTTPTAVGNLITTAGWLLQLTAWALATLFVAGFTTAVRKP